MQRTDERSARFVRGLKFITIIMLVLTLAYYACFFAWALGSWSDNIPAAEEFFTAVNPFTMGSYALGVAVLLYCITFRNGPLKAVIGALYILIILFTLIAVMGMSSITDLIMYLPHLIVIAGCAIGIRSNLQKDPD